MISRVTTWRIDITTSYKDFTEYNDEITVHNDVSSEYDVTMYQCM